MYRTLIQLLPDHSELLGLPPEELGSVIFEVIPRGRQGQFVIQELTEQLTPRDGPRYPQGVLDSVHQAIAEALSWLETQGLIYKEPNSPPWFRISRRGAALKGRNDIEAYIKARTLPVALLQPTLASKVYHLFARGDHDTAVFQAFKEVEVAVRKAAKYPAGVLGRELMTKAFAVENGPLRDASALPSEREAEMFLFAGAIGHAKNPASHREVELKGEEAARLIIFASHLLEIVQRRGTK